VIRVFIADDHALVRAGYHQLLADEPDIRIVGEAASGDDLLARLTATDVDVLVLDVTMPGPGIQELLARLAAQDARFRTLVVSVHPEGQVALRALQAGASGYVNKAQSAEELVAAVRRVHAGGRYITPTLAEHMAEDFQTGVVGRELSSREAQVLRLLGAGRSNKEIAATCGVSPKTVSTYRNRILSKLKLKTNADIVRYAVENGLVS